MNRPLPLAWRRPPPGENVVWISEPTWPTDPRLGGKLLVSLRFHERKAGELAFTRPRIWWLRLSEDGAAIEEAGRVSRTDLDDVERWPALASNPDGGLMMAYLTRRAGNSGWRLRLSRLTIDPDTGAPRSGRPIDAVQEGDCLPSPPSFSLDGRWVHVLTDAGRSPARVDRVSVGEILAGGAVRPTSTQLAGRQQPDLGSALPQ